MGENGEKFVWPPATNPPRHATPLTNVVRRIAPSQFRSRVRAAMLDIERTWFGLDTPPMKVRVAEAGWAPDEAAAYCRRCGATVGMHEADDTGCGLCRGKKLPWERMVRLGPFTGVLREMILEVKFSRWRRLGDDLGRLLGESLTSILEVEGLAADRTILVPVPISMRRRISRGIDHATVIARGVSAASGLPMARLLQRKHGPAQSRLPASKRAGNVAGVISLREGPDLRDVNVIVIDDVTTTRATLIAACRAVQNGRKAMGDRGEGRILTAVLGVTPERGGG